jgi:hypothetical protein
MQALENAREAAREEREREGREREREREKREAFLAVQKWLPKGMMGVKTLVVGAEFEAEVSVLAR